MIACCEPWAAYRAGAAWDPAHADDCPLTEAAQRALLAADAEERARAAADAALRAALAPGREEW